MEEVSLDKEERSYKSEYNSAELNNAIRSINTITTKSLNVPVSEVISLKGNTATINGNLHPAESKGFDYQNTVYEQSLYQKRIIDKQSELISIGEDIRFFASAPLLTKNKETLGCLVIVDYKERKLNAQELSLLDDLADMTVQILEKHQKIQQLQEIFTDFIHKTVHDLKNPFTSIALTTELLKRKADDVKMVTGFADRLEKANNRVFTHLDTLKAAFPITNANFKLNIEEIQLNDLFNEISKDLARSYQITTDNQLPQIIYGDYKRLKEAIQLLIRYMLFLPEQKPTLSLNAYAEEDRAIIAVSNCQTETGLVLLTDEMDSIYVSISKKLVEMHKGKISVMNNAEHTQCNFYISLPLVPS
jgi:signal transduction histidine kinase